MTELSKQSLMDALRKSDGVLDVEHDEVSDRITVFTDGDRAWNGARASLALKAGYVVESIFTDDPTTVRLEPYEVRLDGREVVVNL